MDNMSELKRFIRDGRRKRVIGVTVYWLATVAYVLFRTRAKRASGELDVLKDYAQAVFTGSVTREMLAASGFRFFLVFIAAYLMVFFMIFRMLGKPDRSLKKSMKRYGTTVDDIEREWDSASRVADSMYLTNNYVCWLKEGAFVLPLKELVWLYVKANTFSEPSKLSHLKIVARDGRTWCVDLESQDTLYTMLFAIEALNRAVLTGYSDRLNDLMHNDFDAIVREVEDRRLKLAMYGDGTGEEDDPEEEDDLW